MILKIYSVKIKCIKAQYLIYSKRLSKIMSCDFTKQRFLRAGFPKLFSTEY